MILAALMLGAIAGLPPLFMLVIELLFLCAFFYIVWWGLNRIAVPEPFKTIVLVILGLIALYVLWQIVVGSGLHL